MPAKSLYLDDLTVGDVWTSGPIVFTEEAIVAFAREFDPQPMHFDIQGSAEGRFGGIIASGWHVASLVMRDFVDAAPFGDTPLLGVSVDELIWPRPVKPGDRLSIRREVLEIIPSRSKPDRGLVRMNMVATNQDGDVAMSFKNLIQMPRRG